MTEATNEKKIPILDLGPEIDALWDELSAAVEGVMRSGQFILGPEVAAFETEIAQYLGVKHAIGVSSGTDALIIGLRALGIEEGDEVITTSFTFVATAEAVSLIGATPVFVDIDPVTFNIDPNLIEAAITEKTKAIIPVHLFGHAADMDAIQSIADKHNLKILEDVAQAVGGSYKDTKLGTIGEAGAYSFFPSKNLGAFGDAGLIATNDDEVAELSNMLRGHGSKERYRNVILGYNGRLDAMQSAILRVKLPHLDAFNERRRQVAARYRELLGDADGVTLPTELEYTNHVYHQYTIRVSEDRDGVNQRMTDAGISTMVYYPVPVHQLPVYEHMNVSLRVTEQVAEQVLSLPMGPSLTKSDQIRIANTLRAAIH